ncbi:MAG: branched-chain amino acid ABC transporter permease [Rhodospirillales bacterium]|nr:branched-chain amino acid ABC transporter permease [Rhodospirillales bacterium]
MADTAPVQPFASEADAFRHGLRDALGLPALVLLASMTGFGSLARESGFTALIAVLSSAAVWALPGQVVMAELYAAGAPLLAIAVAVAGANARFLPMTVALIPQFQQARTSWRWRYLLAQMISVNTWALAMRRGPSLPPEQRAPYFSGVSLVCMGSGVIGTACGFVLAGALPRVVTLGLVFLNPVYFALLFAGVRHRAGVLALLIGAALGPTIHLAWPRWGLPMTGLLAGTIAVLLDRAWEKRRG